MVFGFTSTLRSHRIRGLLSSFCLPSLSHGTADIVVYEWELLVIRVHIYAVEQPLVCCASFRAGSHGDQTARFCHLQGLLCFCTLGPSLAHTLIPKKTVCSAHQTSQVSLRNPSTHGRGNRTATHPRDLLAGSVCSMAVWNPVLDVS